MAPELQLTRDILEVIIGVFGLAVGVAAFRELRLNKNQFSFAVITTCKERYQALLPLIKAKDIEERHQALSKFVDLCSDMLFYVKSGYVPEEIADEWIGSMMYHLPHIDLEGNNLNPGKVAVEIAELGLLNEYPRIRKAFRISETFDLSNEMTRVGLIVRVKANIQHNTPPRELRYW
ncbi:MAG: hypothetical protein QOD28_2409 [Acidobacteriota bacterium]|nr:hypothetical protein [Acidobacteriota bacterium]